MNLNSANPQMASDLVIIHRSTELIAVSIDPNSRIPYYGQEEERLLVYMNAFAKSSRDTEVVTLQITESPGFMRSSFSLGLPRVRRHLSTGTSEK